MADASKHRGLSRAKEVQGIQKKTRVIGPLNTYALNTMLPIGSVLSFETLIIVLDDGTKHRFCDALSRVIDYWQQYFCSGTLATPKQN